jgi:hypothetical protein
MGFNIRELTFIGLLTVLMFIICFILGATLNLLTGIIVASGLINMIIQGIILSIGVLVVRKFWVATIMFGIYGVLCLPTSLLLGLPGLYKVLVATAVGIAFDVVYYLFRYKARGVYFGVLGMAAVQIPLVIFLYITLKVPGSEFFLKYWYAVAILFILLMFLGVFLGTKIFNRIKKKRAIKLIMTN